MMSATAGTTGGKGPVGPPPPETRRKPKIYNSNFI